MRKAPYIWCFLYFLTVKKLSESNIKTGRSLEKGGVLFYSFLKELSIARTMPPKNFGSLIV
jgi:hypothetical protein